MMNKVAEALDEKFPGIRVGTFAYFSTNAPPALTKPRRNLLIRIPHARENVTTPLAWTDSFLQKVQGWCDIDQGGGVHVWDYCQNFPNGLWLPLPTLYSIAENIKKYAH